MLFDLGSGGTMQGIRKALINSQHISIMKGQANIVRQETLDAY